MQLLYVTPYYKPSWFYGGPPKCIAEQAEYLALHHQIKIDVLTLNINGSQPLFDSSEPVIKDVEGVTVHYLPVSGNKLGRAYFDSEYLNEYFAKFSSVDLIHVHTLFNAFSRKGMQFALKNKIPYVITPHGMLDSFSLSRSERMKKIHRFLFDDKFLSCAKAVQFTTENELKSSILNSPVKPEIVPLGFEFPNNEISLETRNDKMLKLVFLGRINRKKGIDLLIKGLAGMGQSLLENIHLDIYGSDDDNCKEELERLIKKFNLNKNVTFCGTLDPAERDDKLRGYDCLVLTSHQENFGLVVTEALAMALPVFISDKVNLWDFVIENNCGWVAPLEISDITKRLSEIYITSVKERHEKGVNGYYAVRKNFAMKDVSKKYMELYERFANMKSAVSSNGK